MIIYDDTEDTYGEYHALYISQVDIYNHSY